MAEKNIFRSKDSLFDFYIVAFVDIHFQSANVWYMEQNL